MLPEIGYGPTWPRDYRTELAARSERSVAETARVALLASAGFLAGSLGALSVWEVLSQAPIVGDVPPVGAALAVASGLGLGVGAPALLDALGRTVRSGGGPAARRLGARSLDLVRRRRPREPATGRRRSVESRPNAPSLRGAIRSIETRRPRHR